MKRKLLWSLAIGLPLIGVLVIGWHALNVRSARLWELKKKELSAKGITIDPDFVLARRVPQELNAFEAPITSAVLVAKSSISHDPVVGLLYRLREIGADAEFDYRTGKAATFNFHSPPPNSLQVGTDEAKLVEWSRQFDVPIALWIEELEKYPKSQFVRSAPPSTLFGLELPYLSNGRCLVNNLYAMALANLQAGNTEAAYLETRLLLKLSWGFLDQNSLFSEWQSYRASGMAICSIYMGVKNSRWSNAQLQTFAGELDKQAILKTAMSAINAELCIYCDTVDQFESGRYKLSSLSDDGSGPSITDVLFVDRLQAFVPGAIFDEARLSGAEFFVEHYISAFDLEKQQLDLTKMDELKIRDELDRAKLIHQAMLLQASSDTLGMFTFKAYNADLDIKLTRIAIAVERYKLKYQRYPTDLMTLVPEFLSAVPVDWAHQKAPSYEQTPSGRYRIWHPGWDGRDEGGVPTQKLERTRGDLIWTFDPIKPKP